MPKASVDISKDKLSTIIKQIVDEKAARLVRVYNTVSCNPPMYKESGQEFKTIIYEHKYNTGNQTNRWVLIDLFTASTLYAVYKNLNPENQKKFDCLPLKTAVGFSWKVVKTAVGFFVESGQIGG